MIALPRHSPELIRLAQEIASEMRDLIARPREAKSRLKAGERGVRVGATTAAIESYLVTYEEVAGSARFSGLRKTFDAERLLSLVVFFSQQTPLHDRGFFTNLPSGFLHSNGKSPAEDSTLMMRAGTLMHHILTGELRESAPFRSARDLEQRFKVGAVLRGTRFEKLGEMFTPLELLDAAFPGILKGSDPVVREAYIEYPGKWRDPRTVARTVAWILEFGERIVVRNGAMPPVIEPSAITKRNWGEIFAVKYGMRGLLEARGAAPNCEVALKLGMAHLGCAAEFAPGSIRIRRRWARADDGTLEAVVRKAVEVELRRDHPEFFADSGNGPPRARELLRYSGWERLFDRVLPNFTRCSKVSPSEALRRTYPAAFGWAPDQIKPWEAPGERRWNAATFLPCLAYSIATKLGLGSLTLRGDQLQYTLELQQFDSWETSQKAQSGKANVPYRDLLYGAGLSSALKYGAPQGSMAGAVALLFGADGGNGQSECGGFLGTRIRNLLMERNGLLRVNIARLTSEERRALGGAFAPEPGDVEAQFHNELGEHPYLLRRLTLKRRRDLELLRFALTKYSLAEQIMRDLDPVGTQLGIYLERQPRPAGFAALQSALRIDLDARELSKYPFPALRVVLHGGPAIGENGPRIYLSDQEQRAAIEVAAVFTAASVTYATGTYQRLHCAFEALRARPGNLTAALRSILNEAEFNASTNRRGRTLLTVLEDTLMLTLAASRFQLRGEARTIPAEAGSEGRHTA